MIAVLFAVMGVSTLCFAEEAQSSVWDGSVDVSWYNTIDTEFYLSTPAQLAGLAALVNGHVDGSVTSDMIIGDFTEADDYSSGIDSFKDKTVYLMADLDMGGTCTDGIWDGPAWTPIGGQYCIDFGNLDTILNTSFNGTLDGQGHTIKNVYCNRNPGSGFNYRLCSSLGGIVGRLGCHDNDDPSLFADNPTVRNIAITGYVRGMRSTGGIVGKFGKSNEGCIIENCANFATVSNTDAKGCGGIVGAGWNEGYIKNCYNVGSISSVYLQCPTSGISGSNEADIYNCYNVGKISATKDEFAMGIGTNNGSDQIISNCYWLEDSAPGGGYFGNPDADVHEVSGEYMKTDSFLEKLNGDEHAFVADAYGINNGYPILACQIKEAEKVDKSELEVAVDAVLGLKDENYTAESWAHFEKALDIAQDVLESEEVTQDDVDQALEALNRAINGLKIAPIPLTIAVKKDGVEIDTVKYDLSEWKGIKQQHYSARDSLPSYRLASAEGVFLTALLDDAGIDIDSIIGFNFISTDGFGSFMSKSELLDEERYYYPNIHGDNKEEDAVEVKPILATRSYVAARGSTELPSWDIIDKLNAIRLFVGQKNPNDANYGKFVKWIYKLEVEVEADEPASKYELTVEDSDDYEIKETEVGLMLILRQDVTGFKHFGATVKAVEDKLGQLEVVFTHLKNDLQQSLNSIKADFDAEEINAKAGFNIEPSDVIKIYMVDELTNETDRNPIILR